MAINQVGSLSEIKIHRMLPVVNGFVQVPNNLQRNKSIATIKEALLVSSSVMLTRLGPTGGASTAGTRHGNQELIELPGVALDAKNTIAEQMKAIT